MTTFNRVGWAVIGFLLLAAGVVGALASLGRLSAVDTDAPVLSEGVDDTWRSWGNWAAAASIAVGVIIAFLGVLLLRAELRRRQGRALPAITVPSGAALAPVEPGEQPGEPPPRVFGGTTHVESNTLAHALSHDLARNRWIEAAAADLTGRVDQPALHLRLTLAPEADVATVRRVVDSALDRFTTTSGLHPRLAKIEFDVARPSGKRPSRVDAGARAR